MFDKGVTLYIQIHMRLEFYKNINKSTLDSTAHSFTIRTEARTLNLQLESVAISTPITRIKYPTRHILLCIISSRLQ